MTYAAVEMRQPAGRMRYAAGQMPRIVGRAAFIGGGMSQEEAEMLRLAVGISQTMGWW